MPRGRPPLLLELDRKLMQFLNAIKMNLSSFVTILQGIFSYFRTAFCCVHCIFTTRNSLFLGGWWVSKVRNTVSNHLVILKSAQSTLFNRWKVWGIIADCCSVSLFTDLEMRRKPHWNKDMVLPVMNWATREIDRSRLTRQCHVLHSLTTWSASLPLYSAL